MNFNNLILWFFAGVIFSFVVSPELVGKYKARMDNAYDHERVINN